MTGHNENPTRVQVRADDESESEYDNFSKFAAALVKVPKSEIDAERAKDEATKA
jgi:hypothetical protein